MSEATAWAAVADGQQTAEAVARLTASLCGPSAAECSVALTPLESAGGAGGCAAWCNGLSCGSDGCRGCGAEAGCDRALEPCCVGAGCFEEPPVGRKCAFCSSPTGPHGGTCSQTSGSPPWVARFCSFEGCVGAGCFEPGDGTFPGSVT